MTRYELQREIFSLYMSIYPTCQHEDIYKHMQKLWKREDQALRKFYKTLQEIAA